MPYIETKQRGSLETHLNEIRNIKSKGELEFCIFKLMKIYMSDKKVSYSELHNCTYAAQHCADEFRRRFLDKREDQAIGNNGDILPHMEGFE